MCILPNSCAIRYDSRDAYTGDTCINIDIFRNTNKARCLFYVCVLNVTLYRDRRFRIQRNPISGHTWVYSK